MAEYYYYSYDANGNLVKKKKEEESPLSGWLQKGASDESVAKTVLGTGTDVVGDLLAGAIGMGENIVDFGATLAGGVGKLVGADQFASNMEQFVKKDLYDANDVAKTILSGLNNAGMAGSSMVGGTYTAALKNDKLRQEALRTQKYVYGSMEQDSILAEKADSVVQSIGQMLTTSGIAATTGVPWELTTAITSFGAEMDNALNSGASFGEAIGSSAISAAGEVLGEKLFSGSFLGEKGIFGNKAKDVSKTLGKSLAVNLWNTAKGYLGDMTGEAVEEVFSEIVSNLGSALYKEQNLGDILASKKALQGYLDAAIGGALMGGVANAKKAAVSAVTGKDYETGLTQNEQKVFQAEYDSRIEEAKAKGEVSKEQKQEIYDDVLRDMGKGRISTDTIEKVLGGDDYNAVETSVKDEDGLKKRLEEISAENESLLYTDMTDADRQKMDANKQEIAQIEEKLNGKPVETAKRILSDNVFRLVQKDARLRESYYERGRRSQKFEADTSQYKDGAKEIVQKAIDSGILNNTRATHDLVDFVAKAAPKVGTTFNWTDNAKLAEAGYALEGKVVNGYVGKDGITLNVDANKALNTVVGHEITHVLEGTELYKKLSAAVVQYAKTKGDYDTRLKELSDLYKGVENSNVDRELVADLIGDYLFTDSKFLDRLAQDQNLFQKVWSEVKYLYNIATAGSDEAKQLLEVKRAFERAYQNATKNTAQRDGVDFSINSKFYDQFDKWDGKTAGFSFVMGETSDALVEAGIPKKQIRMDATKIISLLNKHKGMTPTVVRQIPELLEHPVIVIDSKKNDDARIVMGDLRDANNKAVTVVLLLTPTSKKGNVLDIIKVSSAEGRGHLSSLFTKEDGTPVTVRYTDKKRIRDWLNVNRLQLPLHNLGLDSNINVPQPTPGVKPQTTDIGTMSLSNKTYADISMEQQELRQRQIKLEQARREAGNNPELNQAMHEYSDMFTELRGLLSKRRAGTATQEELDRIEELKAQREETMLKIQEMQESLGLNRMAEEERELRELSEELRKAADEAWEREGAEKENKAIEKSGLSAEEYFRKKALKAFKTTANFNEAGYLLPDGKMLNFSGGERNKRYRDHREIGEIYEATQSTAALNRFLKDGNIRIMAESPGIDIPAGVEPTKEQYAMLRKFINTHGSVEGQFFVDISDTDGRRVGHYGYNGKVNADRVINDIKHYYATGEVRAQSGVSDFLSISAADTDIAPIGNYNVYGKDVKIAPEDIAPVRETASEAKATPGAENTSITRKELHSNIMDGVKRVFAENGYDFDKVLKNAKNLSTFATVDNTPQRVLEKALGYKEGQILSDITVNKVAQNESEGIKWLNSQIDTIKQISKQYGIKPGSKESAAAQMYAEGFYVNDANEIVAYGDAELAQDFKDAKVRQNIKLMASDPRIREIYDNTLSEINASRTRNAYPEIPRLENYFLHFRAMEDTFSKLGLPFNPNDIKAKDLPTDLNGVTADLKPGQPYFASAMHRKGKRTSFDLLGGLERYLNSAKNQIYHIDDIQNLRALRNYIADTYGQANGLSGLDTMSEEEAQARIKEVFDSHLSTFAKFLNEEANVLAGKTSLIDRGLEGVLGRRGITFLNDVNKQVGKNMVGWNLSSSLTNFIPVAQTFAKTNKADFVKAFGQTVASKISGKNDNFAENSPVMIRRKGADAFYRTPFQKASDAGYVLAGMVDNVSTELIARTKFNELTRKGMDAQKAHFETDKWVSRLMGDRSIGQQPQLYNSKMLGLFTKFQLEVRNQLDSQFYDTIQEAKASNEYIEDNLKRNAKTAAKITSTFAQLAIVQHLFGEAFEAVAGYNPAFDIISVMLTALGFDDDEDSEDTFADNLEQGFLELLEDLPYTSTFTGGRIPISTALPVEELLTGKDEWGNDKSRWETIGEIAPYYVLPGGYGQLKKTVQGLQMFDEDLPIAGSYTKSGNLRFAVENTPANRVQAALFGQYASENARDYFDNERSALREKQIEELKAVDIPMRDYWEYREGLVGLDTLAEKADYIASLDLPIAKKNILVNNQTDRKTPIDLTGYEKYGNFEEFDMATRYPEKYAVLKESGISVSEYKKELEKSAMIYTDAYSWAADNPGKYALSKAITNDVTEYKKYTSELNELKADKDRSGNAISGTAKAKKVAYINGLDIDYGKKLVLYKSLYPSDKTYDRQLLEYLGGRDDLSADDLLIILEELGFKVSK